jgi:glutamate--cysteine ligase
MWRPGMSSSITKEIAEFNRDEILESLSQIKRGFEKESLRTDENGKLATTPHPKALGSSLRHPLITTDYSESLLEFVTLPTTDISVLFNSLTELHQYTHQGVENEFLWNGSMPCQLPSENEIPIAEYGTSNLGKLKTVYRLGLGLRYGRRMQMISGVHYNFSFSENFWSHYATFRKEKPLHLSQFISEQYLGMLRNAQRLSWILPFLFGASPAVCSSFFQNSDKNVKFLNLGSHTYFLPDATSLRLSDLGYQNKNKPLVKVSYNSFSEFLSTMHQAVHTSDPQFSRLGVKVNGQYQQLSDCVLQIEDEHYAMFRPKRVTNPDERMLAAMQQRGIEYVEIRALDNNPFFPIGIDPNTVYFLDVFLTLCLLMESPPITEIEEERLRHNHTAVVMEGRNKKLILMTEERKERNLRDWAKELLSTMQKIAEVFDSAYRTHHFTHAIEIAQQSVENSDRLPSTRIISELQNHRESYREFMIRNSKQLKEYFTGLLLTDAQKEYYDELVRKSLLEQKTLEQNDLTSFDEFLKNYLVA